MLIIVCGLQGTGKSTAARLIAEKIGARRLRSDVLRRTLFEPRTYSATETDAVYEEMFRQAAVLLGEQTRVVLDATFAQAQFRQRAVTLANQLAIDWCIVEVTATLDTVRSRIAERTGDASEAEFATYLQFRAEFEPIQDAHIVIDNSGNLDRLAKLTAEHFGNVC